MNEVTNPKTVRGTDRQMNLAYFKVMPCMGKRVSAKKHLDGSISG
jgi:hypothetical protein